METSGCTVGARAWTLQKAQKKFGEADNKNIREDTMRYLELKIQASEQGVEQITALLLGMGITEMSIDDPHDMDDIL